MKELKFQLSTAILTVLTLAALVAAVLNLQQQYRFHKLPEDGAIWVDRTAGVEALYVRPGSAADRAGIRTGDRLLSINDVPIHSSIEVTQILTGIGTWKKVEYRLTRGDSEPFPANVITSDVPTDPMMKYQYFVAFAYLAIGLFVYFRRGSAHKAAHFYVMCLTSFIAFSFHYTGQLNNFDKIILYGNVLAGPLAATLFLHFCLTFPEPRKWLAGRLRQSLLYVPAVGFFLIYVGFASGVIKTAVPLLELRWLLDRIWVVLAALPYLIAGVVVSAEYRKAEDTIVRQQLKWLRNGTFCGYLPYCVLYLLPYVMGAIPNQYLKLSVLPMMLIPLTLAYAIVRYRLMDVDILFRRGYAYTLATICILTAFWAGVILLGSLVHVYYRELGTTGQITVMLIAAFLFQPVKTWIQEKLDQHFYSDRYDYRRTLVEFAKELSSEGDLDRMLSSCGERLLQTLSIRHLAFFLEEGAPRDAGGGQPVFRLKKAMGQNPNLAKVHYEDLDLSFLNWNLPEPYIFFERTRHQLDAVSRSWPASVRRTIADLDLTYYLPCTVRGRTIAWLGVSRTTSDDFLSSVDVELLITLAGSVGIAIENAGLYRSLQQKVAEYERLKEFSENIVESINVGILAADLQDRVESWNTQIEQLSGIERETAVGRRLNELFPPELAEQFDRVRGETGIHHIYKFVLKPADNGNGNGNGNGSSNGHGMMRFREATLNIAIAPLVSKDGEQIGRLVIFDDITDRAELEQRLVQADKLSSIGLLAAGVAHEVNTPLAVISTYAQMLAKQVAEDSQKSLMLDKIAKQTFRASEIVNSLLNFSRTSTTSFGEVGMNRVLQETLSLLEHQLQKSGVQVKTDLENGLEPIYGNAGKLQQVFLNLFLNARDAMSGGGTLEVRTWSEGAQVKVEVSDTGMGIAAENLHRIYDPFFTTKPARKGTGLGLSVTYGIVREHGGTIEVSNRPSGGARFRLEFPLARTVAARKPVNAA